MERIIFLLITAVFVILALLIVIFEVIPEFAPVLIEAMCNSTSSIKPPFLC